MKNKEFVKDVIEEQKDFLTRVNLTLKLLMFFGNNKKSDFNNLFTKEVKKKFRLNDRVFSDSNWLWEFCDSIASQVNYGEIMYDGKFLTFTKNCTKRKKSEALFCMSKKKYGEDSMALISNNLE